MKLKSVILPVVLICLMAAAIYHPATGGGFFYDDKYFVADNPHIRDILSPHTYFLDGRTISSTDWKDPIYRPVRTLWYAILYLLFGLDPKKYHVAGIILHALNSILVYLFAHTLLKRNETSGTMPALICAMFFLLHPAQVETASWISAQGALLACTFGLMTLLCGLWIQSRPKEKGPLTGIMGIFYLLSVFSYESAAGIPLFLVLIIWVTDGREGLRKNVTTFAALGVGLVIYSGCHVIAVRHVEFMDFWGGSIMYHIGVVAYSMLLSLKVVVLPIYTRIEYVPNLWASAFGLRPFLYVLAVSILLVVILNGVYRRSFWSIPLAGWLIFYMPSSNLIPNSILFGDRLLYLPLISISIGVGLIYKSIPSGKAAAVLTVIMLAGLTGISFQRAEVWRDPLQLWTQTMRTYPKLLRFNGADKSRDFRVGWIKARLLGFNGSLHISKGAIDSALEELMEATKVDPGDFEAHMNLGLAFKQAGHLEESVASYKKAIKLSPPDPAQRFSIHDNLGNTLTSLGKLDEAVVQYKVALSIKPKSAITMSNLATAYIELGQFDEAEKVLIDAILMDQASIPTKINLAALYIKNGKAMDAVNLLEQATLMHPNQPIIIKNLAYAYLKAGMKEEAGKALDRFTVLYPAAKGSEYEKQFLSELGR